jgi:hypothetical protein
MAQKRNLLKKELAGKVGETQIMVDIQEGRINPLLI